MLALVAFMLINADDPAPTPIEPAKLVRKEPIDFARDIAPVFEAKCSTCHSGKQAKGGFDMSSVANIVRGGKKGQGIVPGKPGESNVYLSLSHQKKPAMPPSSENDDLSPEQVALVKLWIEQGAKGPKVEEKRTLRTVALTLPPALVRPVRALAMSPNGNVLAVGRANQVRFVDAKTGEILATLIDKDLKTSDGKPANAAYVSLVESLAFSPDGKLLATGSYREVTLWDVEKKTIITRIGGFADKVTAIAWTPKGDRFATAGGAPTEDGEVRLFDSTGKHLLDFKSPHSDTVFGLAFSPDGTMLATGGADKFVRAFDLTGKLFKSFEGHTQHVLDVGWSPDGKRIVSAGADDLVKIWDYEKGEKTRDLKGASKQVLRLAFVGKTPNFLTVGGDASVRRWSVETGDPSRTFDGAKDYLYAVAANADGSLIASGGEEGIVRIYDGKTAQLLKSLNFEEKK